MFRFHHNMLLGYQVFVFLNYYHSTIECPDRGRQPVKFDFIILIPIQIKYPF